MKVLGVPSSWLNPLLEISGRESTWNPNDNGKALDSSSTAYGLFQLNNDNYNTYAKGLDKSNALNQAIAGIKYIKDRYGNPVKALNVWDQHKAQGPYGWY